jgi:group I intron endonuclease
MKVTIYCAHCICTGKKYIGQTRQELKERIRQHKNSCSRNKYKNVKFYNAIKKYGWENFIWGIIEEGNIDIWNTSEIYWIEHYNTYEDGYNLTEGGNNRIVYEPKCKEFELVSPDGTIFKGKNIRKFCIENEIPLGNIYALLKGKSKSCKGWKIPDTKLVGRESQAFTSSREYEIMSPDGKIIRGRNVSEFCRKNNLFSSAIIDVLNGKLCSHQGWKLPTTKFYGGDLISKSLEKDYKIISPEGIIFTGKGVRTLCRKFNLSESGISEVLNGKKKHYKGWKKFNDPI